MFKKGILFALIFLFAALFSGCTTANYQIPDETRIEVYRVTPSKQEIYVHVGEENQGKIRSLFNRKKVVAGNPNCTYDYIFSADNTRYGYHRECGNITLIDRNEYFTLTEKDCRTLDAYCLPHPLETAAELAEWIGEETLIVRSSFCCLGYAEDKVLAGKTLKELKAWISGLSIEPTSYENGYTPQDSYGAESYSFDLGNGKIFYCYLNTDNRCDILFKEEWYQAQSVNPEALRDICGFAYEQIPREK